MTIGSHAPAQRSRVAILVALCLAAFIISVDVTIVNVALPTLVRRLGASTTQLQWIVDAYSLVFAAFVLAAGSLSDRLGRKGVLLMGLAVFAVGSLTGAFSGTIAELIASRAFMGLGRLDVPLDALPPRQCLHRAWRTRHGDRAVGRHDRDRHSDWSDCRWVAPGALLVGSIFAFMAVVAAGIAVLVAVWVPASRDPSTPPIDWRGLLLSAAGMTVLIFGVIEAPDWGWRSSASLGTILGGLALLNLFVLIEQRTEHPMLDVALFRNPRFTAASGSVAISFFALSGFIFLVVQYFQFVKGYTPLGTGVRLLPVAGSVAVTSVVGTKLAVRVGNKVIVEAGLLLFATGLLWASTASGPPPISSSSVRCCSSARGWVSQRSGHRSDHGCGTSGEGGSGICRQRCYAPLWRDAWSGGHWQRGHVPVHEPTGVGVAAGIPERAVAGAKGSVGGAIIASRQLSKLGFGQAAHGLAHSATNAFLYSLAGGCRVVGAVTIVGAVVAIAFPPARPRQPEENADQTDQLGALNSSLGAEPALGSATPAAAGSNS